MVFWYTFLSCHFCRSWLHKFQETRPIPRRLRNCDKMCQKWSFSLSVIFSRIKSTLQAMKYPLLIYLLRVSWLNYLLVTSKGYMRIPQLPKRGWRGWEQRQIHILMRHTRWFINSKVNTRNQQVNCEHWNTNILLDKILLIILDLKNLNIIDFN